MENERNFDGTVMKVAVLTPDGQVANFSLSIIGLPEKHFYEVPGGGDEIREAFKLEGLEGHSASVFFIKKVSENSLRPPKYIRKPKEFISPSFLFDQVIPTKRVDIMTRKKTKEELREEKKAKGLKILLGKEKDF